MPKNSTAGLRPGEWITFRTKDGDQHGGELTYRQGKVVRAVDAEGRQYVTSSSHRGRKIQLKSVRAMSMGVFVLDTQLDKSWRSDRHAATFWEEYCRHAGWSFGSERVHSLADLQYVLGKRVIREPVILFNGHGHHGDGWRLSNGDCLGIEAELTPHPLNNHKLLLFSSCGIGSNAKLCRHLLDTFRARALVSYTANITDEICFLAEPALLQLFRYDSTPERATATVKMAFDPWKRVNAKHSKVFPIVCHSRNGIV